MSAITKWKRELAVIAAEFDYEVRQRTSKSLRLLPIEPLTGPPVFVGITPSDHRVIGNIKRDLKAARAQCKGTKENGR